MIRDDYFKQKDVSLIKVGYPIGWGEAILHLKGLWAQPPTSSVYLLASLAVMRPPPLLNEPFQTPARNMLGMRNINTCWKW